MKTTAGPTAEAAGTHGAAPLPTILIVLLLACAAAAEDWTLTATAVTVTYNPDGSPSFANATPSPTPSAQQQARELNIDAFPLKGELVIRDEFGNPVSATRVTISLPSGGSEERTTLADGLITLPSNGGKYSIVAEKKGYLPAGKSFYAPPRATGLAGGLTGLFTSNANGAPLAAAAFLLLVAGYAYNRELAKRAAAEKKAERRRVAKLKLTLGEIFAKSRRRA